MLAADPTPLPPFVRRLATWPAELLARERRLTLFAAVLLALLVPMALAAGLDTRTLRGVDVWIKPMKFALSIALLSLTTTWFAGHLPAPQRSGRGMRWIVRLVIGAGGFEFVYIALQAALGQASHYNVGDVFHTAMYALMGIGAMLLTATQPMLAWLLYRHPDRTQPVAYRRAVLIGLVLTFVLGAGVGTVLAGLQPPGGGPTVPLFGWSLAGGDLRPAHFVGIHAEQVLPVIGFALSSVYGRAAGKGVWLATLAYLGAFAALVAWGLPQSL